MRPRNSPYLPLSGGVNVCARHAVEGGAKHGRSGGLYPCCRPRPVGLGAFERGRRYGQSVSFVLVLHLPASGGTLS